MYKKSTVKKSVDLTGKSANNDNSHYNLTFSLRSLLNKVPPLYPLSYHLKLKSAKPIN